MKTFTLMILSILLCTGGYVWADEEMPKGKVIFMKSNCTMCHTVKVHDLGKTEAGADTTDLSDISPPDLSGVGLTYKAEWIEKYLLKVEKKDGKKHRKRFSGTEEELKTLVAWLGTLQTKLETEEK